MSLQQSLNRAAAAVLENRLTIETAAVVYGVTVAAIIETIESAEAVSDSDYPEVAYG